MTGGSLAFLQLHPPSVLLSHKTEIMEEEKAIQPLLDSLALKKQAYTQQQNKQTPVLMVPESPGPHRLQPRPERPQDITYRQQQIDQEQAEQQSFTAKHDSPRWNGERLQISH